MHFFNKKAQDGYLLDEYTFLGKTMSWQEFARLQNTYILSNIRTADEIISINLAKWVQEKQRAEQIINNEQNPVIKEQMEELYKEQCFALDNVFFGKDIHRPFI